MPFGPHPDAATTNPSLDLVTTILDPVLVPLGFAPGQAGAAHGEGQVIFCRGDVGGPDTGCVDLVIDLAEVPEWRVVDVRYWGFPEDRWHLDFERDATLRHQASALAQRLPEQLS